MFASFETISNTTEKVNKGKKIKAPDSQKNGAIRFSTIYLNPI
jgi:hypothetical protein